MVTYAFQGYSNADMISYTLLLTKPYKKVHLCLPPGNNLICESYFPFIKLVKVNTTKFAKSLQAIFSAHNEGTVMK